MPKTTADSSAAMKNKRPKASLDCESFLIHYLGRSKPRPFPCAFYRTAAGNEPVREWLKELPESERKQVGRDIKAVQFGWPLGLPLVDSLGDGLREVRSRLPSRIARTIFFVQDETIILLHAFIKKTRATPDQELDLARKRKHEVQKQSTHRK
jgi:phage-related protein